MQNGTDTLRISKLRYIYEGDSNTPSAYGIMKLEVAGNQTIKNSKELILSALICDFDNDKTHRFILNEPGENQRSLYPMSIQNDPVSSSLGSYLIEKKLIAF